MTSYRTPLSRARGLGAAGHGVSHWISERVGAIALVPLTVWGVWAVVTLASTDYIGAIQWLSHPLNGVLMSLLAAISFWHMHGGMRVIVEDYVHGALNKAAILLLNLFVCVLGGALTVFSILKVALGGA